MDNPPVNYIGIRYGGDSRETPYRYWTQIESRYGAFNIGSKEKIAEVRDKAEADQIMVIWFYSEADDVDHEGAIELLPTEPLPRD